MAAMTGHLISLGHRHIAYVDMSDPRANPWKRQGVDAAVRNAGLEPLHKEWVAGCRHNQEDCAAALDWFMGLSPRPTAVVCSDDTRARMLITAARERGIDIPGDLSVTGYGDTDARKGLGQDLTTVLVDPAEIGRKAAEILVRGDPNNCSQVLIEPGLIIRETAAPPRA